MGKELRMDTIEFEVKCCRCQRVRTDEGRWIYEEKEDENTRMYSHSYCPSCLAEVHADLEVCVMSAG